MELTNKRSIKELSKKYNAKPERYLGQHFILSKSALKKMIEAADIKKTDTIVEIGPGLGTLTQELTKILHPFSKDGGLKIIAIEKDPLMISILKETLADYKNIKVVQDDARQLLSILRIDSFGDKLGTNYRNNKYKIVANLPYNIATFLIRSWLEMKNSPKLMVLMIQKEVAQRICSKPPRNNLLGISVQFYAEPKIIGYVPKSNFWPRPKVDAAIIKIVPKKEKKMTVLQAIANRQSFFHIVKAGFSQPRKQLAGNLSKKLNISKEEILRIFRNLDISSTVRAENLSLDQWLKLAHQLIHN
jgi:16S rRNA (adenine1518-N6/adenine1519-N6)-dimethyltransferase